MLFSKTKILIIEDHPIYLNGLKNHIARNMKNSDIDCAVNGQTAIEKDFDKIKEVLNKVK